MRHLFDAGYSGHDPDTQRTGSLAGEFGYYKEIEILSTQLCFMTIGLSGVWRKEV